MICPLMHKDCEYYQHAGDYDPIAKGIFGCSLTGDTDDDMENMTDNDCPCYEENL